MDRLVHVAAGLANQIRGPLRRSRRRIYLPLVVELDDLALGHVRRRRSGHLHHQDGADREVGRHEDARLPLRPLDFCAQAVDVEAGRAHDRVHACAKALADVSRCRLRGREVDDYVARVEQLAERGIEGRISLPRELHVVGTLDRLDDGLTHAARSAGDADPDHAAASASLTEPLASLKSSSWGPMQAAERRSGS